MAFRLKVIGESYTHCGNTYTNGETFSCSRNLAEIGVKGLELVIENKQKQSTGSSYKKSEANNKKAKEA